MKIRTLEDNQEILYVEISDIAMLEKTNREIPTSICLRITDNDMIAINYFEKNRFIDFDDPDDILFLDEFDWIIDYQDTMQLAEEEINLMIKDIDSKIERLYSSKDEKNSELFNKKELLIYKKNSLIEIMKIKEGSLPTPFLLNDSYLPARKDSIFIPTENHNIKRMVKAFFHKQKSS